MPKINAIFCDFDWTLFDHKTRTFNMKGVEGLNKAHEQGIKLVINSARTYYALERLKTFELIPFDCFVTHNGGACFTKERTIYADFIDEAIKNELIAFLDAHGFGYNLLGQYSTYIKIAERSSVDEFYQVYYEPFPRPIEEYKGEPLLSIQVFSREESDPLLSQFALKHGLRFRRFFSTNTELTQYEFVKSKGIKTMYDHLRLRKEEAMAFGDDLNDIPMFEMVKYGICLGNGKDEAKQAAYYVTDSIEDDGLYKALVHFGIVKK